MLSVVSSLEEEKTPTFEEDLFQLALMYMNGRGRVQDEYMAYQLYEKAAKMNHAKSICSLGYMNEIGLGTPMDKEKAVAFYRMAADLDDEIASCNYAFVFMRELAVKLMMKKHSNILKKQQQKICLEHCSM